MITDLRPKGDTSSISMSEGNVWLNPLIVTETRWIRPTSPATVMGEGYSEAAWPDDFPAADLAGRTASPYTMITAVITLIRTVNIRTSDRLEGDNGRFFMGSP